NKLKPRAVT
ncbi:acyl-CoA dehydrogenase domain protein, partial [Vibrio harveyi]